MKISAIAVFLSFLVAVHSYSKSEYDALIRTALNEAKSEGYITDDGTTLAQWFTQPVGSNFNCKQYGHKPATTVHELTPYDIKIIGAMGNSVTAGFGAAASNIATAFIEYRELSWTIGGYKDLSKVTTIPNILRKYNPKLRGYSTKGWLPFTRKANNNVAVTGAVSQDVPKQARRLVNKIKSDSTDREFREDWKLVSLWIGGNNLCSRCKNRIKHSTENYIKGIKEALDYLRYNLPRTFVNLVQIIDVTQLAPLKQESKICHLVHNYACSCVIGRQNIKETSKAAKDYQDAINKLVKSQRYNTKDDFTVVVQPFFEGVELPTKNGKPDQSYFAPDCFHFSTKGHAEAAIALWNNMIQPVGRKTIGWEIGGGIHCPTKESPYFYTEKNSKRAGGCKRQSA